MFKVDFTVSFYKPNGEKFELTTHRDIAELNGLDAAIDNVLEEIDALLINQLGYNFDELTDAEKQNALDYFSFKVTRKP